MMVNDGINNGINNDEADEAIEILDLPIKSMVMFHSYVSLPEGNVNPGLINLPIRYVNVYQRLMSTLDLFEPRLRLLNWEGTTYISIR